MTEKQPDPALDPPTDRRTFIKTATGAVVGTALLPQLGFAFRAPDPTPVAVIGAGRQGRRGRERRRGLGGSALGAQVADLQQRLLRAFPAFRLLG